MSGVTGSLDTTKFYVVDSNSTMVNVGPQYFDIGIYVPTTGELVATKFTGTLNGTASSAVNSDKLGGVIASNYALKSYVDSATAEVAAEASAAAEAAAAAAAAAIDISEFTASEVNDIWNSVVSS